MSKFIKATNVNHIDTEQKKIAIRNIMTERKLEETAETDNSETGHEENASSYEGDHKPDAQAIVEEAKQEAAQIVEQAKQEAEDLKKQLKQEEKKQKKLVKQEKETARSEGYEKGYQEGAQEAKQQCQTEIDRAQHVVSSAKLHYEERIQEAEPVILNLAMKVAARIISSTFDTNENAWLDLVKQAIAEVREHPDVKIYVHPDWYELTLKHRQELQAIVMHTDELYIYPDMNLPQNGCIIESPLGQVDVSVDSQLKEIKSQLAEKLKERTEDGSGNAHS
ncbi:flagellar assembly protein FliH [Texcoconibacillus texcoconensis]|uniref:Flagellar assembly protein FliH n=1 Tax=Texcoconibacillus texcoconensis TaxID=1095777 RepID=A0A840QL41_9BACI|nr:flagellar assembly protein FliH [Texcoconibacillus texcoconensis]MBB5172078.1 flagellar assembly protein FliH [Texcoconibacillus texcoconensis]